jgi:hypothetical protein
MESTLILMDNPGDYWMGRVVTHECSSGNKIGHITGFSKNTYDELIPIIKWHDGTESSIHPGNIELH